MRLAYREEPLRILDFDVEARPLSWYGGDFVTKEITAIAWAWVYTSEEGVPCINADGPACYVLEPNRRSYRRMLKAFCKAYADADMVTGHFIRGFDLPVIQGALKEEGLPLLGAKLTQDTKIDLVRSSGLSKSQENLGAMLGIDAPKIQMTQADWRAANRLSPDGIEKTIQRVIGDVIQHVELRQRLLDRGMLSRPRVWTPESSGTSRYHA